MQALVDLNRCLSYGQCVYAAPDVFAPVHEEVLESCRTTTTVIRDVPQESTVTQDDPSGSRGCAKPGSVLA